MTVKTTPVRRNFKFNLPPEQVTKWNPAGFHVTQFFNTLSIFFPVGERFFIHSLRQYRDIVEDPQLRDDVAGFIGQEAFHGREHDEYNAALTAAGLPADKLEAQVTQLLEAVKRLPKPLQLGATVALEHLTAIMGDILLREPELLANAEPHFQALWRWHALEETEHKAVSFEVFTRAFGSGPKAYLLRVGAFLLANAIFWSLFYPYYFRMVRAGGQHRDIKGWWRGFRYQWGTPGALRRIVPAWFDFFRPDFHPWMHDNRHFLDQIDELTQRVESLSSEAPLQERYA